MFGREGPQRLRDIARRLEAVQETVPRQAVEFHASLAAILEDAYDLLDQKVPIFESERVDLIERDTKGKEAAAGKLGKLVREALAAREKGHALRQRGARELNASMAAILERRCDVWVETAAAIGVRSDREADVDDEQDTLSRLENDLRQHESALDRLAEGAAYIDELTISKTGEYVEALPGLLDEFAIDGPDARWLAAIEMRLAPLRILANQPPPPPPAPPEALRECQHLLADVIRWTGVLELPPPTELQDELQKLESLARLGRPVNADELLANIQHAEAGLRAQVRDEVAAESQRLNEEIEHYTQACGPNLEIVRLQAILHGMPADSPPEYLEWKEAFTRTARPFHGFAKVHVDTLGKHLHKQLEAIEAGRSQLAAQHLTAAARQGVEGLEHEVQQNGQAAGVDAVLTALRASTRMRASLAALERQTRKDQADHHTVQRNLQKRNAELQEAAASVGCGCRNFAEEIDREWPTPGDLDHMNRTLQELAEHLENETRNLVAVCVQQSREDHAFCLRAGQLLKVATGVAPSEIPPPTAETPRAAAAERDRFRRTRRELEQKLLQSEKGLQVLLEQALNWTEDLLRTPGCFNPMESLTAKAWVQDLATFTKLPRQEILNQMDATASLYQRHQAFADRFRREEESVRQLHATLTARFRVFTEEEFREYCGEIAERVSGLLYGVNLESRQYRLALKQLREASELLRRLEQQGRRRAAAELEEAMTSLEVIRRSSSDLDFLREIDEARKAIADVGHEHLPPLSARRRLLQIASDHHVRDTHA